MIVQAAPPKPVIAFRYPIFSQYINSLVYNTALGQLDHCGTALLRRRRPCMPYVATHRRGDTTHTSRLAPAGDLMPSLDLPPPPLTRNTATPRARHSRKGALLDRIRRLVPAACKSSWCASLRSRPARLYGAHGDLSGDPTRLFCSLVEQADGHGYLAASLFTDITQAQHGRARLIVPC